jgi:hypothetical protein
MTVTQELDDRICSAIPVVALARLTLRPPLAGDSPRLERLPPSKNLAALFSRHSAPMWLHTILDRTWSCPALTRLCGNNEYQSHIDGGVTCWASREIVAFPLVKRVRNHALAKSEALKKVVGTRRLSQRIGRVSGCVGGGLCGPLT